VGERIAHALLGVGGELVEAGLLLEGALLLLRAQVAVLLHPLTEVRAALRIHGTAANLWSGTHAPALLLPHAAILLFSHATVLLFSHVPDLWSTHTAAGLPLEAAPAVKATAHVLGFEDAGTRREQGERHGRAEDGGGETDCERSTHVPSNGATEDAGWAQYQ
jgi:hypothetical protein